jgi:exopolyphosphatase/guanosine-5'-triphosphate,3'-diphosphate pyrophosphatase
MWLASEIQPVCEQSKQTRLGHGFYETHRLMPDAIAATATAIAGFVAMAREAKAVSIRVLATSAAREAVNREKLTTAIEQAAGLKVEVISGDQEAELGFRGVTTDPQLAQAPLLLVDVGGGSAQFTFGQDGSVRFRQSFPARLRAPAGDPSLQRPAQTSRTRRLPPMAETLSPNRSPADAGARERSRSEPPHVGCYGIRRSSVQLVGVGGAATILACMEAKLEAFDRARIEATRLSAARVSWHLEHLWSLPLEERKKTIGLPKNRADVILMGVAIYHAVMEEFGFCELRISTRGLALRGPDGSGNRRQD